MILGEIAKALGVVPNGDAGVEVVRCASVENGGKGSITYVDNPKLLAVLETSGASAVIIGKGMKTDIPSLEVERPAVTFVTVMEMLHPEKKPEPGIDKTAIIDRSAKIGEGCRIGPYVSIGAGTVIGDRAVIDASVTLGEDCNVGEGCRLHPHVTLYDRTVIGDRVILHAGVVIGSDGFRYETIKGGKKKKVPHIGMVRIGDDVEIGANSCVDRAVLDETVIGNGVKIDNLVQIGHNTVIGDNTVIAGNCGISGSCRIGSRVVIGGQVGIADHIEIADDVIIAGKTGVSGSIKKPGIYGGHMAMPVKEWRKAQAAFQRGAHTLQRVNRLDREGEKK